MTQQTTKSYHTFTGVVDQRRRLVGSMVCTWEGETDNKFYVWVSNTRNGKAYGASSRSHTFDTAEERAAYIAKYLRDAENRFTKRFGKA